VDPFPLARVGVLAETWQAETFLEALQPAEAQIPLEILALAGAPLPPKAAMVFRALTLREALVAHIAALELEDPAEITEPVEGHPRSLAAAALALAVKLHFITHRKDHVKHCRHPH
jgi:hypothetical protein